jgi:hypothetical protein
VNRYPAGNRRTLAIGLVAAAVAYGALLIITYLQLTPSRALLPDLHTVDRLLFGGPPPVSRTERLLEATEGPMSRGGTMRPAFTDQSLGWDSLTQNLSVEQKAALLAEREGERLAILDWLRAGAPREAYENDRYELRPASGVQQITADYALPITSSESPSPEPTVVRLRTLLRDRCVTCHGENGRHDIARFIELDTYDRLLPHLMIEPEDTKGRGWLVVSMVALFPLSAISAPLFSRTNQPRAARAAIISLAMASLAVMIGCWLLGSSGGRCVVVLLAAASGAAFAVIIQMVVVVGDLLVADPNR